LDRATATSETFSALATLPTGTNMNTHDTYEQEGAAQRYAMNEMTAQEQAAFEDHYFDCTACGNEVVEWTRFFESGREAVKVRQFKPKPRPRLLTWIPSVAAAALAVVVGLQGVALQSARVAASRIDVLPEPVVVTGETRSEEKAPRRPANQVLLFTIEVPGHHPRYRVTVRRGSKVLQTGFVRGDQAKDQVNLAVPPLPEGSYMLVVEGVRKDGNRTETSIQHFEVREETNAEKAP
jgi:hypothetical protein